MAEARIDDEDLREWLRNAQRELPRAVSNRIQRTVVTEASKHFERALKAQTPTFDTGTIKRSITRVLRQYRRRGRRGARGPDKYFLGVVGPSLARGPHAHLVEFGTDERYARRYRGRFTTATFRDSGGVVRSSQGFYRGSMPAQPFFEQIFEAASSGGTNIVESILERELSAEYQRIADGLRVRGGE